jgi:pyridoxamine 5'-phosphate oxidase
MPPEPDPLARFGEVFARAAADAPFDYTAASLATADATGQPSVRIVLVRSFDEEGFLFYTNYRSRKAADIEANPRGALCFYWPWIDEQVRIEGALSRVSAELSDTYFAARPRGSQIGAWASEQSRPLEDRSVLERRYLALDGQYEGQPIPRPSHWGGYRLSPAQIEFWKAGEYRLHDRWLYTRDGSTWRVERLHP